MRVLSLSYVFLWFCLDADVAGTFGGVFVLFRRPTVNSVRTSCAVV